MDFVAIDFETANHSPASACQLAAVVVQDSEIIAEHSWLIRPQRSYFAPRNIAIHGIRPGDVVDAPNMAQVWGELADIIDGYTIIAHNARFDLGVLVSSLESHDVACPDLEFNCTRLLAKRAWPGRTGYGLKPLGNWLGVDFQHHDALEDSRCCAQIALRVAETAEQNDLTELESILHITRGHYRLGKLTSPRSAGGRSSGGSTRVVADRFGFPSKAATRANRLDAQSVLTASARKPPLEGKHIVMLGPLGGMDQNETHQFICDLGGIIDATISSQTDYVVACGTTLESAGLQVAGAIASVDEHTAEASSPQATGIRVLSQRQFRAMLPAGKTSPSW